MTENKNAKRSILKLRVSGRSFELALLFFVFLLLGSQLCKASDLEDVRDHFRKGEYSACIELANAKIEIGMWNDVWFRMLIESYLVTGKYAEALEAYERAIEKFPESLRLRLIGVRVYRMNDQANSSAEQIQFIDALLERAAYILRSKADLVPLGEFFLLRGEDPKEVLKICYDQAIKNDPKSVDAYLATARMALDKNDDKVASQALAKALSIEENDPELFYLLARAWGSSDPAKSALYLGQSLQLNPRYVPSLILQAESRMSAEAYEDARVILDEVERINPNLPKLWALRAAIAHLQGEYSSEGELRRKGLVPWELNPEVDFTIGKQLSMHYRFAESADYQRRALKMDPDYVPAQTQLAQDLLRLGELDSGWEQVNNVRKKDPYDVTIFNLKQLQSQLENLDTIEAPGFVIRMDKREAKIYGQEVVDLLSEARTLLTEKYNTKLVEPIFVEIFPRQKEFAVRTFGMPGGEGFLGVCFGRLITANSPAALTVDSNWQAVLWHEYCHVVTLQKTKNKMPRWLSEGISVYEERQRNPIWGQSMDATYRTMILGDDFVPMSKLSGAFLRPKTPMHLQFAYYEASLAIEYWVEKYGMKNLLRLLDDLSVGMPADEALRRAPGSLEALDEEFTAFARDKANQFAEGVDLATPKEVEKEERAEWLEAHPKSVYTLRTKIQSAIVRKNWDDALGLATELQQLIPNDASNDGIYSVLASIHRARNDLAGERTALVQLAERSADCRQALMRLIEIDLERADFVSLENWSGQMLAIDPLRLDVQQARARSAQQNQKPEIAIRALQACLQLEPIDPAIIHYQLAISYESTKNIEVAKKHVLLALEESPRYIEALEFLAKLNKRSTTEGVTP